jgi:hypothetical protein
MTGAETYDEAAQMPLTDVLDRYQALNDRDSMARSIATLKARGAWHADRSLNPDDYPPLTTAEHLEMLALGEALARYYRHPVQVHHAVLSGATWEQISAATGSNADEAQQAYRDWAEGQHRLRQDYPGGTIGMDDDEYAAALKAAELTSGPQSTCRKCGAPVRQDASGRWHAPRIDAAADVPCEHEPEADDIADTDGAQP